MQKNALYEDNGQNACTGPIYYQELQFYCVILLFIFNIGL